MLAAASLSGVDNQLVLELELSCWLHEVLGAWPCRTAFTLGRGPSDELVALRWRMSGTCEGPRDEQTMGQNYRDGRLQGAAHRAVPTAAIIATSSRARGL